MCFSASANFVGSGLHALCAIAPSVLAATQRAGVRAECEEPRQNAAVCCIGRRNSALYLWALTAYPLQVYVRGNNIVYVNQATNHTAVALLYVIATCGSLFFQRSE